MNTSLKSNIAKSHRYLQRETPENPKVVDRLLVQSDLKPGYFYAPESARYLNTTTRKISLYRRYNLLKFAKFGKNYVYRKEWLDEFAETWAGYDLSNESKVKLAIREKEWRTAHDMDK